MAYSDIKDPSAHFHTQVWTGNSGYTVNVVNDANSGDFQPDLIWAKDRVNNYNHNLVDSSRGVTKTLWSDTNAAEMTASQSNYDTKSFNTNGFTTQAPEYTNSLGGNNQTNGKVAWQWKANGGTTASNTDGSITSTVQANQDAGFSIVTYTGGGSAATIGHGLGVKPELIILKKRNGAVHWYVRHASTGSSHLVLSLNAAAASVPSVTWTTTEPTSSVFSIGSGADFSANGGTFIAYCFAEKQGYSKFGKYVGNGNADGPFVYTGFKPAWVMTKRTDTTSGWFIQDIKRGIRNSSSGTALEANSDLAESGIGATNYDIDFLSNGFKLRQSNIYLNATGGTYIYMAFAEHPFVAGGVPTIAG